MRNNRNLSISSIACGIFFIGFGLAFMFGSFNLPIFFVGLAFSTLVGSMSLRNPQSIYGGLYGFFWLI